MTRGFVRAIGALLVLFGFLLCQEPAHGHELDSASLSLTEEAAGRFRVRFNANSRALGEMLKTPAVFPEPCRFSGGHVDCGAHGLVGTLVFPWLEGTLTRVMVDIQWKDGSRTSRVVNASSPSLTVYGMSPAASRFPLPIVGDYTLLGIEHVLTGFDHLLFVVALTLLARSGASLVATVTAFTLAHSLTLAAAVLGLARIPTAPVEAAIALSIVLVCAECVRPTDSLAKRAPWAVAFAFGLLHGFGFASALLEIELPERFVPAALLSFNVGVELGQLAVVGVVGALGFLTRRVRVRHTWLVPSVVYAMGAVAVFWSLDRIVAMITGTA